MCVLPVLLVWGYDYTVCAGIIRGSNAEKGQCSALIKCGKTVDNRRIANLTEAKNLRRNVFAICQERERERERERGGGHREGQREKGSE